MTDTRIGRYMENFALWCEECVTVTDKLTGASVPFRLNAPQRRVAGIMEDQRLKGQPIRMILLKARQWGGRTYYHLLIYLNYFINFALWKRKL